MKHTMHKAKKILYPNLKLLLKKQAKPVIGLKFCGKQIISTNNNIISFQTNVQNCA